MKRSIAVLVGSLRKDSYNLKVAKVLQELAKDKLDLKIIKIDDLPFYNEDIDNGNPPASYTRFRQDISGTQGVLFVSPEYNRTFPAVIKNALDVGSRPYGQSVWAKKPVAIITVSQGATGGFGANHHLRQPLVFLDMPALQQPEMYLGAIQKCFDEKGNMIDNTKNYLAQFVETYTKWVEKFN